MGGTQPYFEAKIPDNYGLGVNSLSVNKKAYSVTQFLTGNSARDVYFSHHELVSILRQENQNKVNIDYHQRKEVQI